MREPSPDALYGQALQVTAGLAEPDALEDGTPDAELTSHEMVQRHPSSDDIAAAIAEIELDPVLVCEGLDRL